MGRPKGSLQKSYDRSRYLIPDGIAIKLGQDKNYNKETKLIFIDEFFGEFTTTIKALQDAGASTHPSAVMARREKTCLNKYGIKNAGGTKEARQKAQQTMMDRYGHPHALENEVFLAKSRNTLRQNYGVDHPMASSVIKERQKDSLFRSYGVRNPMYNDTVKAKVSKTVLARYGKDNFFKTGEFKAEQCERMASDGYKSYGEEEIAAYINSLGIDCEPGTFGGRDYQSIDIKVRSKNLAIEFNGCYWHTERIHKDRRYHLNKTLVAESKGYTLIHIFDYEWDNRKEQVKSFLRSALKANTRKFYARNADIKVMSKTEANEFLEKYHILGKTNIHEAFGLYVGDELLGLISIGKHHRNNNEWILNRFVMKENVSVAGGLSRLCKQAVKKYGRIVTWIDRRFSNGKNWEQCGWKTISTSKPDYFYFDTKKRKVVSKQSRKKQNVNTPAGMTESQHAKLDGLERIWDCGKIKMELK